MNSELQKTVIASPKGVAILLWDCFVAALLAMTKGHDANYNRLPLIIRFCSIRWTQINADFEDFKKVEFSFCVHLSKSASYIALRTYEGFEL